MRILVTGASGFAGAMLVPRLVGRGDEVRALARDPARAREALSSQMLRDAASGAFAGDHDELADRVRAIDVVPGDLISGQGLAAAMDGVAVAYYLVHSMESPGRRGKGGTPRYPQRSLLERERSAATRFALAAAHAGVQRIVYLGGLVPDQWSPSPHLASRHDVERILLEGVEDPIAMRASIVIGARSRSFRLLVHLVERVPVLALPPWRRFRTQPIDGRDLIAMLAAAARVSAPRDRTVDVAGPDVVSYGEMLEAIAETMLVRRVRVPLRISGTPVSARLAAALTGEDPALTMSLMEGLRGDLMPSTPAAQAADLFGIVLHTFSAALEHALREWEAVEPLAAH
jgi:uncharacterized protein YbjT (DUF2867 family)